MSFFSWLPGGPDHDHSVVDFKSIRHRLVMSLTFGWTGLESRQASPIKPDRHGSARVEV